ncbi:class Ib ribonucleoside-diphosphate reductase assembly flavoprotein NrdI [Lentilactobacillus kosonis]|uniref:Ribonucleotide reduction protein NrdI n=1 Tax=Lentilactobacillus kosonis TaxID=2810561 RepID=A0A401FNB6_9LACO|nr:class Ib ribonucleoside-diphosphate reductase assembly flavoprotein NrdI [Lentilactobacillus kosonis]GAY73711.1 ribonucleotide reduction protein NrdI [Lentilactobacillus kosonis]
MKTVRILFISIEGNTRSFLKNLTKYAESITDQTSNPIKIELTEISEQTDLANESAPFFAFVPTYLDGGNGIDNGVTELMTNALGEYIEYGNNARLLKGVVGSGNRNFNEQYCLTAKRYASKFNAPFLADYELRGTGADVERIYKILSENA